MREALICHYIFVKTQRMVTQRMSPNANYRLGLIVLCQWWLVHCDKCATLGRMLVAGYCAYSLVQVVCGTSLCLFLNFAVNLKSLQNLLISNLLILKKKLYLPSHSLLNVWLRD